MRVMRRASTTAGLLILALLPVAAAVSPEAPVSSVPMNVMQPMTSVSVTAPLTTGGFATSESELLVAVGGALMALAAIVRRTGKA